MSSKITSGQVDDFTFVMTCLQNSDGGFPKPDFDKVAAAIGAKNSNACYHRLWAIKSKWGMTASRKGATATLSTSGPGTPKTPRSTGGKRGRPAKKDKATAMDKDSSDEEIDETPVKKTKMANGNKKASNGTTKKAKEETSDENEDGGNDEEAVVANDASDELVVPMEEG